MNRQILSVLVFCVTFAGGIFLEKLGILFGLITTPAPPPIEEYPVNFYGHRDDIGDYEIGEAGYIFDDDHDPLGSHYARGPYVGKSGTVFYNNFRRRPYVGETGTTFYNDDNHRRPSVGEAGTVFYNDDSRRRPYVGETGTVFYNVDEHLRPYVVGTGTVFHNDDNQRRPSVGETGTVFYNDDNHRRPSVGETGTVFHNDVGYGHGGYVGQTGTFINDHVGGPYGKGGTVFRNDEHHEDSHIPAGQRRFDEGFHDYTYI